MVRESRGRNPDALLERTDGEPDIPCAHESAVNREAGRVAQRLESLRDDENCVHSTKMRVPEAVVKQWF